MRRLEFPGGWYAEARPDGRYVVLIRDQNLLTNTGPIPLPPGGNLLQFRLGPGDKFAGQGHGDGIAWEWDGSQWVNHGPSFGLNACIYSRLGSLVVVRGPGTETGSQGYRYIAENGEPVPAWETYDPTTPRAKVPALWEYTERGDLIVGQGAGGVTAVLNKVGRYQASAGQTTFVRFNRDGDQLAISWVQEDRRSACLLWLTSPELAGLPAEPTPAPPVVVVTPPPPPVVIPEPAPVPEQTIPNQLGTVQAIRAKYPTPLGALHPAFLIEVALATGARLLRKDGGSHVTLPNGVNVSQDILMFNGDGVDILGDGEGAATPSWQPKGFIAGEYVDVHGLVDEHTTPPPAPAPTPQPAPVGCRISEVDLVSTLAEINITLRALISTVEGQAATTALQLVNVLKGMKYAAKNRYFGQVTLEPVL